MRPTDAMLEIPADRIRESVPWKLRHEGLEDELFAELLDAVTGDPDFALEDVQALPAKIDVRMIGLDLWDALTPAQVEGISTRFSFPERDVAKLSRDLAVTLNPPLTPSRALLPRTLAVARAQKTMRETITDLEAAADRMTRGIERLDDLDTEQAKNRDGAARFLALRADYDHALREIETLHRKLRLLADTPDVALDLRPADKRAVSDQRRTIVLTCLFEFWTQAGRKLTVTTDPYDNNRRKGPLVEFVNAVVRCITDPSQELSGDVIFDEATHFKSSADGT